MKKFLGILAIAGTLVACDNSGSGSGSDTAANKGADTGSTVAPITPTTGDTGSTTTGGDTGSTTTGGDTSRRGQ